MHGNDASVGNATHVAAVIGHDPRTLTVQENEKNKKINAIERLGTTIAWRTGGIFRGLLLRLRRSNGRAIYRCPLKSRCSHRIPGPDTQRARHPYQYVKCASEPSKAAMVCVCGLETLGTDERCVAQLLGRMSVRARLTASANRPANLRFIRHGVH